MTHLTLATAMKDLRIQRGLSIGQVSRSTGLSKSLIFRLEAGERAVKIDTLRHILTEGYGMALNGRQAHRLETLWMQGQLGIDPASKRAQWLRASQDYFHQKDASLRREEIIEDHDPARNSL